MKKVTVEITFEENTFSCAYFLLKDMMEAFEKFNEVNLAWSKICSISLDGLTLSRSDSGISFEAAGKPLNEG
jgi:hypothetical protein